MKPAIAIIAGVTCLGLGACDVDQTQKADAPEVEINAEAGQLPRYDVDGPEVNVGTENVVVQVPDVDVSVPDDDAARAPATRE